MSSPGFVQPASAQDSASPQTSPPAQDDAERKNPSLFGSIDVLKSLFKRWPEPGWVVIEPGGDGSIAASMVGHVHLETDAFELFADEVGVFLLPRKRGEKAHFRIFARGNLVVLRAEQSLRGETFLFDSNSQQGVVSDVRLRLRLESATEDWNAFREGSRSGRRVPMGEEPSTRNEERERRLREQVASGSLASLRSGNDTAKQHDRVVAVAAQRLEISDLQNFCGNNVSLTTCDFARPHWDVWAKRVEVIGTVETNPESGEPETIYNGDLEGVRLRVGERTLFPLPGFSWSSRWNRYLPLRRVSYSNSSKFGNRVDTLWDGSFLLPKGLRKQIDLLLRGDYLSDRGLGYGADLRYGQKPRRWNREPSGFDIYGEALFYAINDRGEDRNDVIPETNDRNRARWHQRMRFKTGTLVDVEYSVEKDRNFLEEYYQRELREEKAPENLIYLRQPFGDDVAVTVLAKKRLAPYRTVVERLPEIGLFVVEKPIAETGVHVDLAGRASYLRFLPSDLSPLPSERQARGDVRATLSRAFGSTRYGKVRPFIEVRGSAWEEDRVRQDSIERFAVATGARLGWHLGRTFDLRSRAFGFDRIRHVVQPEVSYRLVFENNVDPDELFRFDSTEEVDHFEVITFGVRQFLFARTSGDLTFSNRDEPTDRLAARSDTVSESPAARKGSLKLAEFEVEIDYFPDSGRDNSADNFGPVSSEFLVYPYPGQALFVEADYDVETGGRFQTFNAGVQLTLPRDLELSVSQRYRRRVTESVLTTLNWPVSEKYEFEAFLERDLRRHRWVNQEFAVIRNFHQWSLSMSLEFDEGEDDNVAFKVNFAPKGLLRRRR